MRSFLSGQYGSKSYLASFELSYMFWIASVMMSGAAARFNQAVHASVALLDVVIASKP